MSSIGATHHYHMYTLHSQNKRLLRDNSVHHEGWDMRNNPVQYIRPYSHNDIIIPQDWPSRPRGFYYRIR